MGTANWIELLVALLMLLVVGLAAWIEISLSAVSRRSIRELLEERLTGSRGSDIEVSRQLRSSMHLVQIASASIWAALITHLLVDSGMENGLIVGIATAVVVALVAGRIIPSWIVGGRQGDVTGIVVRVGSALSTVFAPLLWPVDKLSNLRYRVENVDELILDSEGNDVTDSAEQNGDATVADADDIEADEHDMLTGVLQLDEGTAHDVMVPRIDLVALPNNAKVAEAVEVAIGAGHSRIPVYGENVDEITGILYVKDLLKYVTEDHEHVDLEEVTHPSYFVPETKPLDDLLHELQQAKIHMAVVIDEYGGTAGVVTIEDILEEIVGEIEDEFDKKPIQFDVVSNMEITVDGRLMVDDVTDHFDLHFDDRPAGTVSGLIQRELGHIPEVGESIEAYRLRLTVLDADRQRVRSVRCEYLGESSSLIEPADDSLSAASR